MTRGGDATPEPFDLSEISRSGDLFDDLAARRVSGPPAGDPATRLLAALVADVDAGAPPLPAPPARVACTGGKPGRPVVRAFVTFGAATLMLTSAGAAVAGGGAEHGQQADGPAVQRLDVSERSKGDVALRALPSGGRAPSAADGGPGDPPAPSVRDRRRAVPVVRHRLTAPSERPGSGSAHAPAGRGGDPTAPVTGRPYGPLPSPSPSPSSPPAASPPPQSPPTDPPGGSSTPPGSGLGERSAVVRGAARHADRPSAGPGGAHASHGDTSRGGKPASGGATRP